MLVVAKRRPSDHNAVWTQTRACSFYPLLTKRADGSQLPGTSGAVGVRTGPASRQVPVAPRPPRLIDTGRGSACAPRRGAVSSPGDRCGDGCVIDDGSGQLRRVGVGHDLVRPRSLPKTTPVGGLNVGRGSKLQDSDSDGDGMVDKQRGRAGWRQARLGARGNRLHLRMPHLDPPRLELNCPQRPRPRSRSSVAASGT
jgi:hypothetical protein